MQKVLLLSLALLTQTLPASAQLWLELGARAGFHFNGMFNDNIANDPQHDYSLGHALASGLVAGINVGDYHGINVEVILANNQQQFNFRGGDSTATGSFVNRVNWKTTELNLLYRYYSDFGAYVEIGPKIAYIREIRQRLGIDPVDLDGEYESSYLAGIFGIGGFLAANETLTLKIGLRADYALADLVSAKGKADNYPAFYTSYPSQKPTRPFRIGISLELCFGVGGIASAQCGSRNLMFGTRYR